jgi:hypothetical protein
MVEVAERFADGLADTTELRAVWFGIRRLSETSPEMAASMVAHERYDRPSALLYYRIVDWGQLNDATYSQIATICASGYQFPPEVATVVASKTGSGREVRQASFLRCIFGSLPFRAVSCNPEWLSWRDGLVRHMAEAAYQERAFPSGVLDPVRLAILADALEEAGATDADLLSHLRNRGPHVRGCAALDLLTHRE